MLASRSVSILESPWFVFPNPRFISLFPPDVQTNNHDSFGFGASPPLPSPLHPDRIEEVSRPFGDGLPSTYRSIASPFLSCCSPLFPPGLVKPLPFDLHFAQLFLKTVPRLRANGLYFSPADPRILPSIPPPGPRTLSFFRCPAQNNTSGRTATLQIEQPLP